MDVDQEEQQQGLDNAQVRGQRGVPAGMCKFVTRGLRKSHRVTRRTCTSPWRLASHCLL
jgi:hypothetical protein